MKIQALTIILGILLLTTVSALYAGESTTIDLGQDYEYYSVVGNTSEVVLDIQQNGTVLTITPDKYSVDDTYEIIFFNKEKETITVYRGGGGGGGTRTVYKDNNVTEYVEKIEYVDNIIEKESPVEVSGGIEYIKGWSIQTKVLVASLVIIILFLLFWNFFGYVKRGNEMDEEYDYRFADEEYNTYTNERGRR